ncbi:MAG: 16S rRNA (cytosine(1402)-N(4))-methyltransferase RsmH [Candidatus Saccharimonadales bacterium]
MRDDPTYSERQANNVPMHTETKTIHVPVLLTAVLDHMQPMSGESYLDVTAGYGGHATAVLEQTGAPDRAVLVDRDAEAIAHLRELESRGARLLHTDFSSASRQLVREGARFDMVLADIGVSSLHLDKAERGFSFQAEGPLDMRMDVRTGQSAADMVNTMSEEELAKLLRVYGEEPRAKKIAAAIVATRPLTTTTQLAEVIAEVVPRKGRVHPATKSFQALRIAVNDELGQLEQALDVWLALLAPGGRLGVISFHSLEDRIVKKAFAQVSGERYDADYALLTKRPVTASDAEIVSNPRSRSAKLRVVAKINTKRKEPHHANTHQK